MRRGAVAILAIGLSLVTAPAVAEDQSVRAQPNNTWDRPNVTINVGEQVTWTNGGGFHNVKFDDGSFEQPADPSFSPWTVSRRFENAGEFGYICEAHPSTMRGRVTVLAPGQTPPPADTTAPTVTELRARPSRVCTRRRRTCRFAGTRFRFNLSEAAGVALVIRPLGRPRGRRGDALEADGKQGANSVRYSARNLKLGRYRVRVTATDAAGNRSPVATTTFTITRR